MQFLKPCATSCFFPLLMVCYPRRDDYLLLSNLVGFFLSDILPLQNTPLWNGPGFLIVLLIHMGPAEYLYYWLHRALHHHYLYSRYHSHHHASFVTEAVSGERGRGRGRRSAAQCEWLG